MLDVTTHSAAVESDGGSWAVHCLQWILSFPNEFVDSTGSTQVC